jgi:hypothetical protein
MIATATLQALVGGFLKIDSTDYDRFEILNNLNAAQRHLLSVLPSNMISESVKNVKGGLSNGVRSYQFPTDLIRVMRLWLSYSAAITDAVPGRIARFDPAPTDIESLWSQPDVLYPVYGLDVEGGFEVSPVPTADQANGFRLQYVQMLPALSAVQDCMLSSQFTNLMVFYATMLSAGVEGAFPDIVKDHKEYFEQELAHFIPKLEKKQ